jgi:arsenite-transporting ATPase
VTAGPSPRFRFFGGKGGVGKTTCAAAAAVAAAERGRRVLIVSTDPAHSLADALARPLGARPRRLPVRRGLLEAVELDADRALERWLAARRRPLRTIAERGTYLDEEDLDRLLALSLPGVDELIGLVELSRLAHAAARDEVVVDTAPTGHTLRLLAMPETLQRIAGVLADMNAKHRFLAERLGAGGLPDAADALVREIEGEGHRLAALLRDPGRSTFAWVVRPEPLVLEETLDAAGALDGAGITIREIVVNAVTPAPVAGCALCAGRVTRERHVMAAIRAALPGRELRVVTARAPEPRGLAALRTIARDLGRPVPVERRAGARPRVPRPSDGLRGPTQPAIAPMAARRGTPGARPVPVVSAADPVAWLDVVAPAGVRLAVFAGKGGVGKTTCAAATALLAAARRRGARVLLLSTDPAHSLGDALATPLGDDPLPVPGAPPGLRAREIDAARAFARRRVRYERAVDAVFEALRGSSRLEIAYDREVVRGLIDLAPPGLDEVFGALSIIEALVRPAGAPWDLVVLDTAPTGHALRLLAMPAAALEWVHALMAILLKYRALTGLGELATDLLELARDLRELGILLRDPRRTRVVAVTRPAALPRLETARLVRGLRGLGLAPAALLVNAVTPPGCARCRAAGRAERGEIARLRRVLAPGRRAAAPLRRVHAQPGHDLAARRRGLAPEPDPGCRMIMAPALPGGPRGAGELGDWARRWTCHG